MPRFNSFLPVLRVTDLQQSIDYYTSNFAFELCWRSANDGGGENAMLQRDAVCLLLSTGSHLGETPCFSGALYIDVDDVDALYESVKDHVIVLWPLEVMEYGQREFGVKDPCGYVLAFAESVEKCRRSHVSPD
jgi:uncharacterized glyoxalase superfamily protein PhnB